MSVLAAVAAFVCGAYLALRTLAACYRVLDLWYTIATAYPRVLAGLLFWGGVTAAAGALAGPHRVAFACGGLAYLAFYLSLFGLRHLLIRKPASPDSPQA